MQKWICITLCVLLVTTQVVDAQVSFTPSHLRGLSYPGQASLVKRYVSAEGGARVVIRGGFTGIAQDYEVYFKKSGTEYKSTSPNREDAFSSNIPKGYLSYKVPSVTSLFGAATLNENFEVFLKRNSVPITCASPVPGHCYMQYTLSRTPQIYEFFPTTVYPGQVSCARVYSESSLSGATKPVEEWRVNGFGYDVYSYEAFNWARRRTHIKWDLCGVVGDTPSKADNEVTINMFNGNSLTTEWAKTSLIEANKDYTFKTVPTIDYVSHKEVYKAGGAIVTINGRGFDNDITKVKVTICGVDCKVLKTGNNQIQCQAGKDTSTPSTSGYLGGTGANSFRYNGKTIANVNPATDTPSKLEVMTDMVSQPEVDNNFVRIVKSWFIPQTSGDYKFFTTCDDNCVLKLSTTNNDPSALQTIIAANSAGRDNWIKPETTSQSATMSLTAGNKYYMEVHHEEGSGYDRMAVGFEFLNNTGAHQQDQPEWKWAKLDPNHIYEQHQVTIHNHTDGLDTKLKFIYSTQHWPQIRAGEEFSGTFKFSSTAGEFKNAVKNYWNRIGNYAGNNLQVTKTYHDANNGVIPDSTQTPATNAVYAKFTIKLRTTHQEPTVTSFSPYQKNTAGQVAAVADPQTPPASKPLEGHLAAVITGTNEAGTAINLKSRDFGLGTYGDQITRVIYETLPELKGRLYLQRSWSNYPRNTEGIEIRYMLRGKGQQAITISLVDGTTHVLRGGVSPYTSTEGQHQAASTNLMYKYIPAVYLRAYETKPQVLVESDGRFGACVNMNCDIKYIDDTGMQINSASYATANDTVTVLGSGFPTTGLDYVSIGNARKCNIKTNSATEIKCEIQQAIAGIFEIDIQTNKGAIPHSNPASKNSVTINPVITIFNPSGVSSNGGDRLTIQGSFFAVDLPEALQLNTVVKIGTTACNLVTYTRTKIQCVVPQGASTGLITVTQQGAMATSAQQILVQTWPENVVSVTPTTISPGLKGSFKVVVSDLIANPLISNYRVVLVGQKLDIECRVVAIDIPNKELEVKFPGSEIDDYKIAVLVLQGTVVQKRISSGGVILKAEFEVTDFNPKQGNHFGGDVVTIVGKGFSSDLLDNQVAIQVSGTTSVSCKVLSANSTHLTALMPRWKGKTASNGQKDFTGDFELTTFLKARIEAKCSVTPNCTFKYISTNMPTVSQQTSAWDSNGDFIVDITGTNFGTSPVAKIDGYDQVIVSSNATNIKIKVIKFDDPVGAELDVVTSVGRLPSLDKLTVPKKYYKTDKNTGSEGGERLLLSVGGLGMKSTTKLAATHNGNQACDSLKLIDSVTVECVTKAKAYASHAIQLSFYYVPQSVQAGPAAETLTCSANCVFETSSTSPTVTGASESGNDLTLAGTGLDTGDSARAEVWIGSTKATTTSGVTATAAVGAYAGKVPVGTHKARVKFFDTNGNFIGWSKSFDFTKALLSSNLASPATTTCSYMGGCEVTLNQPGIQAAAKSGDMKVQVCGRDASLTLDNTTPDAVKVSLPYVVTKTSISQFKVEKPQIIKGTTIPSTSANRDKAFDGDLESAAECNIGIEIPSTHRARLTKVKFFLGDMNNKYEAYVGFTKFTAYSTTNKVEVFTDEIVEGWNEFDYSSLPIDEVTKLEFTNNSTQTCNILEVQFLGHVYPANSGGTSHACDMVITSGSDTQTISSQTTYQDSDSAVLTSILPRFGNYKGNENVVFTGTGFPTVTTDVQVFIDTYPCVVQSATSTQISCTTSKRQALQPEHTLVIKMLNSKNGIVSTDGLVYRYVNLWSDPDTWSGELPPKKGDSVHIPRGQSLLFDQASTPLLNLILVEGELIFKDNINQPGILLSHNILVDNGGHIEAGTKEFPFKANLDIVMHSAKTDPTLPIFGNKVLAVRNGTIDLHGYVAEDKVWTELMFDAAPGAWEIIVKGNFDWTGKDIILAGSNMGSDSLTEETQEEKLNVAFAIPSTMDPSLISLCGEPCSRFYVARAVDFGLLKYHHYAYNHNFTVPTTGAQGHCTKTHNVKMRAEVGLLTRNIRFTGDVDSQQTQFGAHLMMHNTGDESVKGRIQHVEFRYVGQAFQLGRYPIHFHMIGSAHESYIKFNSVHDSYNRGTTLHGVKYLTVEGNVYYNVMGHTVFIEDASETKNLIKDNLVVGTRVSWSLLNTDQTPASFWITHPNNQFIGNHAAGSNRYGFWFDLQPSATGPSWSASNPTCPTKERLGAFENNVAHGNGRYGLRIFHSHVPLAKPCSPFLDSLGEFNYTANTPITAVYKNFVGYKNGRNGAIAEEVGDVVFENFAVIDNGLAGMEMSASASSPRRKPGKKAHIQGGIVVGQSTICNTFNVTTGVVTDGCGISGSFMGVITPRHEKFESEGVYFVNFTSSSQSAYGSCSHCFHPASTDSGARTYRSSKLCYDTTVQKRTAFQDPYKAIYLDLDGTLNGYTNGWIVNDFIHIKQIPYCKPMISSHQTNPFIQTFSADSDFNQWFSGTVCKPDVEVRRIVLHGANSQLRGQQIKILNLDEATDYSYDQTNTTALNFANTDAGGACKDATTNPIKIIDPDPNNTSIENVMGRYDRSYKTNGRLCHPNNYQSFIWREPTNPSNNWAMPFVTGYNYHLHVRNGGGEITSVNVLKSSEATVNDRQTWFHLNHTDRVEQLQIQPGDSTIKRRDFNGSENATDYPLNTTQLNNPNALTDFAVNNETRHIWMPIDGKDAMNANRSFTYKTIRCIENCLQLNGEKNLPAAGSYWSDNATWVNHPLGRVPQDGDEVELKGDMWVILDEDTAQLKYLEINGRLEFSDHNTTTNNSIELKSHIIFVRKGELWVGNSTNPYPKDKTAIITLHGTKTDKTTVFNDAVFEAGNKLLANSAWLQLHGAPLNGTKAQLTKTVAANQDVIEITPGLADAKVGDTLVLFPTGRSPNEGEYAKIKNIIHSDGTKFKLENKVKYTHYGSTTLDPLTTGGIDIRGEVALLNRNIIVQGEDIENWGCNFVSADFRDYTMAFNVSTQSNDVVAIQRNAWTTLSYVEIRTCSQFDSERAALRFESVRNNVNKSSVTHTSISRGSGWGVKIDESDSITFTDNIVFGFVNIGVQIDATPNLIINRNYIGYFSIRQFAATMMTDPAVALYVCGKKGGCTNLEIKDNRIAGIGGSIGVAFLYPTHACGTTSKISGNTVHSSTIGAYPYKNGGAGSCAEASDIHAYKCGQDGVVHVLGHRNLVFKNMKVMDCGYGIAAFVGGNYDYGKITVRDSLVIGESADIPDTGSQCQSLLGVVIPQSNFEAKIYPPPPPSVPIHAIDSEGNFWYNSLFVNVEFRNFPSDQRSCGTATMNAIGIESGSSDLVPPARFENTTWHNVHPNATSKFFQPPSGWANRKDCGQWYCTAPDNALVKFSGTTTQTGTITPSLPQGEFQFIAGNTSIGGGIKTCIHDPDRYRHICSNRNMAQLVIDSLDGDSYDRTFSPLIVTKETSTDFKNIVNSFMDHVWDGFYTGQKRMSRFPILIETSYVYEIFYTGTPPASQRFGLNLAENGQWATMKIHFLNGGFYHVFTKHPSQPASSFKQIDMNAFNKTSGYPNTIAGTGCGENRWESVKNWLNFYINQECEVKIESQNVVKGMVRLEWTLESFYGDGGGTTKFADRIASALGIAVYQMKVVGVYQGSVIVDFYITSDPKKDQSDYQKQKQVQRYADLLWSLYKAGKLDLGAPILDMSVVALTTSGEVKQPKNSVYAEKDMPVIVMIMLVIAGLVLVTGLVIGIVKMVKAEQVHDHSQDVEKGAYGPTANISLTDTMNESKMNDSKYQDPKDQ